jgi:DNA polymerase-1
MIAIDIETSGLYPVPGSKIYCCAVNDGKRIEVHTNIERLRKVLEDKKITKIIHNAAFDCFWLKRLYGITVRNVWDTRLMEQVILGDNLPRDAKVSDDLKKEISSSLLYTLARYGLAKLQNKEMGAAFATRDKNAPLTAAEIEYAKNDVRYLPQLQALQEHRLTKLGLTRVANLENALVEITVKMRDIGLGIDEKKWLAIEQYHLSEVHNLTKKLPPTVDNWNSPAQVKKYFQSIGVPLLSFEDLTDQFIEEYNSPTLNKFIEMRWHSTMASKYGTNFLYDKETGRKFIDPDGRIRVDFEQIINTGRYSVAKPPAHGLPREGQQRSAFVPRKGYVFVRGDFGGQELGVMSAASKEQLWIKALLRGDDPLSLMASMLFANWTNGTEKGCTFPKKCKCKKHIEYRQDAKEITYGIAYGAYPKSISVKINKTLKETKKLFYKHAKAAPKLNRWLAKNAEDTIKTRVSYSADVFRRRRTIRDPEEWMVRNVGFNNPVQACAANMTKLAMVSMSDKFDIVFPWHDEIILEVPKAQAKAAVKELKGIMEKAADYCTGIPGLIKAEPVISEDLSKK